jgi:hypothetical protein
MNIRAAIIVLAACALASAQGFTVNLPADAFLVKVHRSLAGMALPVAGAQGPALDGTVVVDTDLATKTMVMKLASRPQAAALTRIREDGLLTVRYLVPLNDLIQFFDYDTAKVLHTAPDLKADLIERVKDGTVVPNSKKPAAFGLSAGRFMALSYARMLRGAKPGVLDYLKAVSGDLEITPQDYEKEMSTYWNRPAEDEWCMVDVTASVLPTTDKVIVEGVKARVWGLVDESYLPYTKASVTIRADGRTLASDPKPGLPSVGVYLEKAAAGFKSNGAMEKIFTDNLRATMGQFLAAPAN